MVEGLLTVLTLGSLVVAVAGVCLIATFMGHLR